MKLVASYHNSGAVSTEEAVRSVFFLFFRAAERPETQGPEGIRN
jgi:hypothetical protein